MMGDDRIWGEACVWVALLGGATGCGGKASSSGTPSDAGAEGTAVADTGAAPVDAAPKDADSIDATSFDAGLVDVGVADQSSAEACAAGATCLPNSNPCQQGVISCTAGVAQCMSVGPVPDGTACGSGRICTAGSCGCNFPGVQAYFPLDGDLSDHAGGGATVAASGTTFVAGGVLGEQALSFDGISSLATINDPSSYVFHGAFTFCAWVQPSTSGTSNGWAMPIFSAGQNSSADFFSVMPSNINNSVC